MIKHVSLLVILLIVMGLLSMAHFMGLDYVAYQGEKVADGEVWRLFTAHFAHTNLTHLIMNGLALALLVLLFARVMSWLAVLGVLLFSAIFITAMYWLFYSPTMVYVGMSGGLHALFAFGILSWLRENGWMVVLGLFALSAKLAYEQMAGVSAEMTRLLDARVAIEAHLFGAIAGVLFYLLLRYWTQKWRKTLK